MLALIADAADKGEATVFAQPHVWEGTEERFTSLSQCAARLRSLTKPFLVVERRTWNNAGPITFVRLFYPWDSHSLIARFTPSS